MQILNGQIQKYLVVVQKIAPVRSGGTTWKAESSGLIWATQRNHLNKSIIKTQTSSELELTNQVPASESPSYITVQTETAGDWECSSVVLHLPLTAKALGLVPCTSTGWGNLRNEKQGLERWPSG